MEFEQIINSITNAFSFLFLNGENPSVIHPQNSCGFGIYKILSEFGTFKIILDKNLCSMVFWPKTESEEKALPIELLFLFHKYNGLVPSKREMAFSTTENVNIKKCFQQKREMILNIYDLFHSDDFSWWNSACAFSKEWIKVDIGMDS